MFACINQTGCNETAHAYYQSRPELQETVRYTTERIQQRLGEKTTLYLASSLGAAAGTDFSIALTQRTVLKGNLKWGNYTLSYSYPF